MQVQSCSLNVDALKGAVVSNNKGDELGRIIDIEFDLDNHEVNVMIWQEHNGITGIPWNSMFDFIISFQSQKWTFNNDSIVHKVSDAVENILEENSNH